MAHHDQIRALMPDLINGKTHEEIKKIVALSDEQSGLHMENGIKFPRIAPRSNLDALKTFEVRDDDVFVVTYPRSGTHWTAEIVQYVLHEGRDDFSRTFMTAGLEFTIPSDPSLFESTTPGYKTYAAMESPRCIFSHCHESFLPPQVWTKQAKVVYMARNPKDMLISLYVLSKSTSMPSLYENFDQLLWQFYFDEMMLGSWFDHVLNYWEHRNHANVLFLKYEDLHKDLRGSICKIAKHVGKELSDDVIDRITECVTFGGMQKSYKKLEDELGEEGEQMTKAFGTVPHLRKGKVGHWKNTFTVAQNALFDKVYALKMQGTGLEFNFEL